LNARAVFQLQLADAIAAVRSARAWLHESLDELMALAEAGDMVGLEPRINAQLAASNATRSARAAVELMYLAGGGSSVRLSNELQRCMRDMHGVSQHVATGPATWEQAGVVLAGLPPINPLIML
jgi:alkylation response protein AidB-like acyl-CoA dehydrogenase